MEPSTSTPRIPTVPSLQFAQSDVAMFQQRVKGQERPRQPYVPDWPKVLLCRQLITEEFSEVVIALQHFHYLPREPQDVPHLADLAQELVDTIYVLLYTANTFGLDLEPVWQAVQQANMLKEGGPLSPTGKIGKPEGWQPPDIASLIREQLGK